MSTPNVKAGKISGSSKSTTKNKKNISEVKNNSLITTFFAVSGTKQTLMGSSNETTKKATSTSTNHRFGHPLATSSIAAAITSTDLQQPKLIGLKVAEIIKSRVPDFVDLSFDDETTKSGTIDFTSSTLTTSLADKKRSRSVDAKDIAEVMTLEVYSDIY